MHLVAPRVRHVDALLLGAYTAERRRGREEQALEGRVTSLPHSSQIVIKVAAVIGAVMGGLLGVSRGGWQVAQTWQTALSLHGLQVRDFSAQPQWASAVG